MQLRFKTARWIAKTMASSQARCFVNLHNCVVQDIDAAAGKLRQDGFTHLRLGEGASLAELEAAARKLMGLGNSSGGFYNGGGGVTRDGIAGSSFLNGSAGAPAQLSVQFHNEMAYSTAFPAYLTFAMLTQAGEGGTTKLADNVVVTRSFSSQLTNKLKATGVQYIRNLLDKSESSAPDYFMSWQGSFQTDDIDVALKKANTANAVLRRHPNGRHWRHTTWCPVFFTHPIHGELYFASILNRHGSWLDGHSVFGTILNTNRPYHCVWGDGSEFSDDELQELRDVHDKSTLYVHMDKGDIIVMDNLRVAHGRTSFKGDRLIGLLVSDMVNRELKAPDIFWSSLVE